MKKSTNGIAWKVMETMTTNWFFGKNDVRDDSLSMRLGSKDIA